MTAAAHPLPTPEPAGAPSRSLRDLGPRVGPGGTLPKADRYTTRLSNDQKRDIALLVSALREASPVRTGEAIRRPTAWAKATGMHRRQASLLALDWRYLRCIQLDTLRRLVVAVGLGVEAADILARNFPHAIAPDAPE